MPGTTQVGWCQKKQTRDGSFLFQQLSVLIQRFNAVLLHDCFVDEVAGYSS